MNRRGNAAQQIDAALVPVVLWADEYLYSHASSLHFFRKPATLWGMTTLQLGLHQIEQGLAFFKPEERDEYVRAVLRWLKPDGQYLGVNYLIPDEDGPPFGTTRDELWRRFSPHFELVEELVPRSYPNRTGLELLLWCCCCCCLQSLKDNSSGPDIEDRVAKA